MRLSYANVTATLALVLAMGGTSYAAFKLPKDSVGSREVRDRSLNTGDFAPGAVGIGEVRVVTSEPRSRRCTTNCEGTQVVAANVQCPESFRVVGGGVTAPKVNDGRVFVTQPVDNGWIGKVRYQITSSPTQIVSPTVYALCAI